ncbi:MAG: dihydroxyacetone kinase subunit DhaL [Beijerinckiaceae bacterium]|nr:dihydroxyacetone kinase subunit DhaL [Beijerinckiaceae bacterium]
MDREGRLALIVSVARTMIAHEDELTRLDQAIGDGDHGVNMRRGFEAVLRDAEAMAELSPALALDAIGHRLVNCIGGAAGPLYGTLLLSLGRYAGHARTLQDWVIAFGQAIEDVKRRGRSEAGQKTLLDVFVPVHAILVEKGGEAVAQLARIAEDAAEETRPMRALRGRAAFLGERSIGHVDPGARSASLVLGVVGRVLCEEK